MFDQRIDKIRRPAPVDERCERAQSFIEKHVKSVATKAIFACILNEDLERLEAICSVLFSRGDSASQSFLDEKGPEGNGVLRQMGFTDKEMRFMFIGSFGTYFGSAFQLWIDASPQPNTIVRLLVKSVLISSVLANPDTGRPELYPTEALRINGAGGPQNSQAMDAKEALASIKEMLVARACLLC